MNTEWCLEDLRPNKWIARELSESMLLAHLNNDGGFEKLGKKWHDIYSANKSRCLSSQSEVIKAINGIKVIQDEYFYLIEWFLIQWVYWTPLIAHHSALDKMWRLGYQT